MSRLGRHDLARRVAWVTYVAGIPLGMVPGAEHYAQLGGPWLGEIATRYGIRTETGFFFGAAGAGFLALVVIPAVAGAVGYAIGWLAGWLAKREAGRPPELAREAWALVGILPVWGIVLAPASFLLVATLPLLRRLGAKLRRSRPAAWRFARGMLLAVVAVQFWILATYAPLLPNREVLACVGVFAVVLMALRVQALVPWVLVVAALLPGIVGPFAMPLGWRLVSVAANAAVLLPPWLVFRDRLLAEVGRGILTCFVTFTLFWGRLGQMSFMPSSESLDDPALRVLFRGEEARIRSGAFFVAQPCPGWPTLVGDKERARGLVVLREGGGPPLASMRFMASDNFAPDCSNDSIYLADFLDRHLYRLIRGAPIAGVPTLGPFRLETLPHECDVDSPWWLELDRARTALYILDERNDIARADLASDQCRIVATGTKLWDFAIDDERGSLVLGDAGRVRIVAIEDGRELERVDLPGRWRAVLPAAHKTKLAMSADGTIYAGYFNAGTIAKLGREPLRVLASTRLDRGVGLVRWDEARRLLYVGNRNTGALDALDGDTLDVRAHLHVGRRMRTISLAPDGRTLTLGSVAGGLSIDLDRWLASGRAAPSARE